MSVNLKLQKKWKEVTQKRKRTFKGSDVFVLADKLNVTVPDNIIESIKRTTTVKKQDKSVISWVEANLVKNISIDAKPIEKLKNKIDSFQSIVGVKQKYSLQGVCIALCVNGQSDTYSKVVEIFPDIETPISELEDKEIQSLLTLFKEQKNE